MDTLTTKQRSNNMARIRGKDTKPEMYVRRLLHGMGYRYRLHVVDLPGRPDLAFPCRRKVIFVHGCFWHQHEGCKDATMPQSNKNFWKPKLLGNVERDRCQRRDLESLGWSVLIVWECQLHNDSLTETLVNFLDEQ